jgi:hypothetical protein
MPVRRRLAAVLWLVACAACSDPFEAGPPQADANTMPSGPDGSADAPPVLEEADVGGGTLEADAPLAPPMPPVADHLLLWLRSDLGVTETGGAVTAWADLSGHHTDAVQTDATKQPSVGSSGPSGRSAVMFGNDDFMSLPAGFGDFSLGISIFVVFSAEPTTMCVDAIDLANGPEIDDITIGRHMGNVHYEVAADGITGDPIPIGTPALASVVHTPDGTAQLRANGSPLAVGTFAPPASVTRLSNTIGRSQYADCGSLNGGIRELLVYNRALDNDERAHVESTLQTRWGCCK